MTAQTAFSLPPTAPNAVEVIALWLAARAAADRDVIRDGATYRHIWTTWMAYLMTGRNGSLPGAIAWHEATAEDVCSFLVSGPSDRKGRGEASKSEITRRRYWSLLDRVYNFALMNGWVASNPAADVERGDRPKSEEPEGAVLDHKTWASAIALLKSPDKFDAVSVRNRAILQLLFTLGLSPQEIRSAEMGALIYGEQTKRLEMFEADGPGKWQRRQLQLSIQAASALEDWVALRPTIATSASKAALFCTPRGPVSSVSLFLLVQKFIQQACDVAGTGVPPRMGPQVIRNTVLVNLLNDARLSPALVSRYAGLKNEKGFVHLFPHLSREVRLSIKADREDAPRFPGSIAAGRLAYAPNGENGESFLPNQKVQA